MSRCRRSSACQTSPMSSLQHKNKPVASHPLHWMHKTWWWCTHTHTDTLTVVYWDAGVLVRCQDEAAATATQKAAHCVDTLMVTHVAAWVLTLINVCVFEREHNISSSQAKQVICSRNLLQEAGGSLENTHQSVYSVDLINHIVAAACIACSLHALCHCVNMHSGIWTWSRRPHEVQSEHQKNVI